MELPPLGVASSLSRRASEALGLGLFVLDASAPDYRVIDANAALERITGFPSAETLGHGCRVLASMALDSEASERMRRALALSGTCVENVRDRRKDGTLFWARVSIWPIRDSGGLVTHFVGLEEDVSATVRSEQAQEEVFSSMAAARSVAEQANTVRDALLAVVSHELRSPLNAIRLWASLLHSDPGPGQVERSAKQIEASVDSQCRLINDLIDISRIASGKLELHRRVVNLRALLVATLDGLQASATKNGIALTFTCEAEDLLVSADRDRIGQAIRNLVENAIKFTPPGGRIGVELLKAGTEAEIRVVDTGEGIPAEHVPFLFDRFWQADRRDTRSHGGLGLGLSIVKHIAERHGGRITASSPGAGLGARFSLWLPAHSDEPVLTAQPVAGGAAQGASNLGGDVLVVDDDVATAEALSLAIERRGMTVRTVHRADQAMLAIKSARPSILISDLMMPGKSGLDLLEDLRAEERGAHLSRIYAIAITGRGARSDRRKSWRAGFDAFLAKPIHVETLFDRMQDAQVKEAKTLPPRSILVVDDHVDLAIALAERLKRDGHTVHVAHSVTAAKSAALLCLPDVLITDVVLPDGRGDELARSLCVDLVDLITIGMTGSPVQLDALDCLDHVLQKPIHYRELMAILERVCRF